MLFIKNLSYNLFMVVYNDYRVIACFSPLKIKGVLCNLYSVYSNNTGGYLFTYAVPCSGRGSVKVRTNSSCWWNANDDDLVKLGISSLVSFFRHI